MYLSFSVSLIRPAIFFLCVFTINITLAQSNFKTGYVITQEGDTVSGMVDYREGFKAYRTVNLHAIWVNDQLLTMQAKSEVMDS